jgi:uncharacterized membrane protein YhfC
MDRRVIDFDCRVNKLKRKVKYYALYVLLGAGCFFVSQPLIRIPLLNRLQATTDYVMFSLFHPVVTALCVGLSAGIFEEGFRFVFKFFLLRPWKCGIAQPVLFGVGHATMEAVYVMLPAVMNGYPSAAMLPGFVERAISIVLHVALTILVWNGFQTNGKAAFLAIAILIHGTVDFIFPSLQGLNVSIAQFELAYGIVAMITMLLVASRSKKYYAIEVRLK